MKKNQIRFSTAIDGGMYNTFIDLEKDTISVSNGDEVIFSGTIEEFKKAETLNQGSTTRVYDSILNMGEYLIQVFSKA